MDPEGISFERNLNYERIQHEESRTFESSGMYLSRDGRMYHHETCITSDPAGDVSTSSWGIFVGEDGYICSVNRQTAQATKRHFEREETVLCVCAIIY
jgi:hypothetical protein